MIATLPPNVFLRINGVSATAPIARLGIHREIHVGPDGRCWLFTGALRLDDRARHYAGVDGYACILDSGTICVSLNTNRRNRVHPWSSGPISTEEDERFRAAIRQVVVAPRFDAPRRTNARTKPVPTPLAAPTLLRTGEISLTVAQPAKSPTADRTPHPRKGVVAVGCAVIAGLCRLIGGRAL